MIDIMLRMKHWQVFLLTIAPILLTTMFAFSSFSAFVLLPAGYLLTLLTVMFWVYSVFTGLNARIPEGSEIDIRSFRIMYFVPMVFLGLLLAVILYFSVSVSSHGDYAPGLSLPDNFGYVIWIVCVFSFVSWIQGVRVAAKTMKSIEMQSGLSLSQYLGEVMLILFFGIGLWILQPRINKIVEGAYDQQPEPVNRLV